MREESPLLRAARQAALGEPSTPALCIYVVRLLCYLWAFVSIVVPTLDWLAGVIR